MKKLLLVISILLIIYIASAEASISGVKHGPGEPFNFNISHDRDVTIYSNPDNNSQDHVTGLMSGLRSDVTFRAPFNLSELSWMHPERYGQKPLLVSENDELKRAMRQQKLLMTASFIIAGLLLLLLAGLINRYLYIHRTKNQLAEKNRIIMEEKKRSEELLLNILPAETANELMHYGQAIAKRHSNVTVLFTDFKEFSIKCEQMDPENLIGELDYCYKSFDEIISRHNLEKIKTIGDSYMAAGGLLSPNRDHPSDAIEAAIEILQCMHDYKKRRQEEHKPFFEIRIGIHSGPVVSGVVGTKKFAYDIWGDTVNIANRIQSASEAGKINVSGDTFDLVKDRYTFEYRGKISVKYKGEIDMYYLSTTER